MLRPITKFPGGKAFLKKWIISHFPSAYNIYVEPYIGAGSVLLNSPIKQREIINDLDPKIVAIWRILKNKPDAFIKELNLIKYNEQSFEWAKTLKPHTELGVAIKEYCLRRMSRGGLKQDFAWSNRLRGGRPGDVNGWETALAQLPQIAQRIRNIEIYNEEATNIIQRFDQENTLQYIDCPYLHKTRTSPNLYGEYEMDESAHVKLGEILNQCKSKVLISGYPSELYNKLYSGWNCYKKEMPNHSSQELIKSRRIECLWTNF